MKYIFLLVYFAIPINTFRNTMMGEYRAVLESIDNMNELPRNMANWHIYMERKNRKEKIVTGSFTLKKTIMQPWVEFETLIWANGKFIKMALDQLSKLSICDDDIKNNFYYPVFEGNMTWSDDCVLTPGTMRFRKDKEFDVDGLVHKMIHEAPYGRFQIKAYVMTNVMDKKEFKMKKVLVGGITIIVRTERRDL